MKEYSKLIKQDFKTIKEHTKKIFSTIFFSDENKIVDFPRQPLLEKIISETENFKIYFLNAESKLVMFIPEISFQLISGQLIPFEDRFSLVKDEKFKSLKELVLYNRKQIKEINEQEDFEVEDVFSIYIFSGPYLIRYFDINSTSAVIFASIFGYLNIINYDDYNFEYQIIYRDEK